MEAMTWLNEPPRWQLHADVLEVTTGEHTDFWRHTGYGFVRDSGHFFFRRTSGPFVAEVVFGGDYEALYDQCGLMVRGGEEQWLKAGIERTEEGPHLSVVATRKVSDWSVAQAPGDLEHVALRIARDGDALRVEQRDAAGRWVLVRLAALELSQTCDVGVMCCSPERGGFQARFRDFRLTPGTLDSGG